MSDNNKKVGLVLETHNMIIKWLSSRWCKFNIT